MAKNKDLSPLQVFLNSPMQNVAGIRRPVPGDVYGIEIECEGRRVSWREQTAELTIGWKPHNDGSLRNHHGESCEWVFSNPVDYENSQELLNNLFQNFKKANSVLVPSNRTSMHIHFNMSDKTVYQTVNMFILYSVLEGLFDRFCGEDREGNLFCLSSRHAEAQVRWMEDACFIHQSFMGWNNNYRYCSLNLASLNKFGTVEFRGMRGPDNFELASNWLTIVKEFCEYSCYKMKNPVDIVQQLSVEGAYQFLNNIFSEKSVKLLTEGLNEDQIKDSLYEGMRVVQMLSYRVGTEFDQVYLRGKDFWSTLGEKNPKTRKAAIKAGVDNEENPFLVQPEERHQGLEAEVRGRDRVFRDGVVQKVIRDNDRAFFEIPWDADVRVGGGLKKQKMLRPGPAPRPRHRLDDDDDAPF